VLRHARDGRTRHARWREPLAASGTLARVTTPLRIARDRFPGRAAYDVAVSRALLQAVAEGCEPETLRLYQPDDALAFSRLDAARPGFAAAVRAAQGAGFAPTLRLTGGSAAAFSVDSLAFAWSIPLADARRGVRERFARTADWVARALRSLGIDARVGAVPGEYCPGDWSVNARGEIKLMGVGQRIVRGAAHVGGVIVVAGSARLRAALAPVYAALELPFDPAAAGSVEDARASTSLAEVEAALIAALSDCRITQAPLDAALLARAQPLEREHRAN
jgi:lipoate-protein ligase A